MKFNKSGIQVKDNFATKWGNWYYLAADGVQVKDNFVTKWGNWYFLAADGNQVKNSFATKWGNWYFFGSDGNQYKNKFLSLWGNLYYFASDGNQNKNSSFNYNSVWFTTNSSGVITVENKINKYIIDNRMIQQHAWVEYRIGNYPTAGMEYDNGVQGVVVHETANYNDSIEGEMAYAQNNYENAFVHTYIDAAQIINVADTNLKCRGSAQYGNAKYVQFEQVEVHDGMDFAYELNNAAYYTAAILKQYNLTPSLASSNGSGTVWSHHNVSQYLGGTDHTDPDGYWYTNASKYFGTGYNMYSFIELVEYYFVSL